MDFIMEQLGYEKGLSNEYVYTPVEVRCSIYFERIISAASSARFTRKRRLKSEAV